MMKAELPAQVKKAKGKAKPVNFSRELSSKERARQIVKNKTNASQLTDDEIRELVFLLAIEN